MKKTIKTRSNKKFRNFQSGKPTGFWAVVVKINMGVVRRKLKISILKNSIHLKGRAFSLDF
jgi:hypothetical protein